jgi:prophage regulatory protein
MTTEKPSDQVAIQVLRLPQVCRVTGLCRSMIYQLEACERFPRRIKLGLRAVGWVEGEVQEWLATRAVRNRCGSMRSTRSE